MEMFWKCSFQEFRNTKIFFGTNHGGAWIDVNIQLINMQFFYCNGEAQVEPAKKISKKVLNS